MMLENIEYNFKAVTISKKIKGHKIFQKFIDDYCCIINESFKDHLNYVRRYKDENRITYHDPNVIHYIALNLGYLFMNLAVKPSLYENRPGILSSTFIGLFENNFYYLNDDLSERGYICLLIYCFHPIPCDQICHDNFEVDSCNEENEIFFRRFLITNAGKSIHNPWVDTKKIKKKQLKKNIEHFNSIMLNFTHQLSLLMTPEIIKADKEMSEEYKNKWTKIVSSKTRLKAMNAAEKEYRVSHSVDAEAL